MNVVVVLLTGGTIGQQNRAHGSVPDTDATVELVRRSTPPEVEVRIVPVMQRNSPDITPDDWHDLALAAAHELDSGARGIVVLHGTDTLAYTAAALRLALGHPAGPVVLTGSMLPADASHSDAPRNLASAIRVAATTQLGICVVMGTDEPGIGVSVLDPMRLLKIRTHGDAAFASIGAPAIGYVSADDVIVDPATRVHHTPLPLPVRPSFAADVDLIKVTPLTGAARLRRLLAGLRGVVIEGYGAGHVPAAHLEVLCGYPGPVVLTTQVLTDAERLGSYASDRSILELPNIIPAGRTTSIAAVVTLSWALARGQDPRTLLGHDGTFDPDLAHPPATG